MPPGHPAPDALGQRQAQGVGDPGPRQLTRRVRRGYFYAPTILTDAGESSGIVAEEQFGPALPVVAYRDLDDAIERANATTYALGASVWATDTERGEGVARQLEAGSAWVNTHAALAPNLPFGGHKWSGVGVENGTWGYKSFTDLQVVNRRKK